MQTLGIATMTGKMHILKEKVARKKGQRKLICCLVRCLINGSVLHKKINYLISERIVFQKSKRKSPI